MDPLHDNSPDELLLRANRLLAEVSRFAEYYAHMADTSSPNGTHVSARALDYLTQQVRSEVRGLEGVVERVKSGNDVLAAQCISSTNLPYFEALWDFTKQSQNIVALRKWVSGGQYQGKDLLAPGVHAVYMSGDSVPSKDATTLVDIIADDGQQWVKIFTTTSKRLLWDMTKLGWATCADEDEGEDEDEASEDDFDDIPIYKVSKGLAASAAAHRIRNKHPVVRVVLTRISRGESKDVDLVLARIRNLGIEVLCRNDLPPATVPSPSLSPAILSKMAPDPLSRFSEVLNVDTSVLIALISDFSHYTVAIQPWFTSTQLGHLANEKKRRIATWLYPAMGSHGLVCIKEAAETCRHIVEIIGTETEVARLNLILRENTNPKGVLNEFKALSDFEVPDDLQLPVRIVDSNSTACLPAPAAVLDGVTEPTLSVFAFGWATGQTTLTSNGVGVNSLTRNLEDLGDTYNGIWPSIWTCPFSRSLVGVPKHIREAEG
ncbi:hypothetical protein BJ170DRAFT_64408 [Xylariales sp. AK1849]|nr:hypothetical protein BJ170DRAFT_219738 [Xylariales sp. AK1849]KAI0137497.1 hypothetical protein BJ170DRAFT_64408 [Xylariales sp. AK1849]